MIENPDAPGEGDEPYLTPVQANKIVSSLLNPRRRFPFDVKVAQFAIRQTIRNMKHSDARVRNVAVANLIKMEKINQNDDMARLAAAMGVIAPKGQHGTQVNVSVGVQVNQAVQSAVGTEPEYLDWVRQRELAEGGNPDVVGANGFAAEVPDTAPRLGAGPGSNGHH